MPRDNQEQPDVPPFEYRAGVTMPALGGMVRRGDPTQIPPHRLHLGVNIRLADGELVNRPGLTAVEGTEEDACITGIFEIEDKAVAIYITKLAKADEPAPGDPPSPSDFRIMSFNEEKTPPEANFWDEPNTFLKAAPTPWRDDIDGSAITGEDDCFNTFQRMGGRLLLVNGLKCYEAVFSEDPDSGQGRLDLAQLFELPTASVKINSTCIRSERVDDPQTGDEFDKDVLYMGTEREVWRYDGTTIELVHTLPAGGGDCPVQVMSYYGFGLVAAGNTTVGFSYQEQPGYAWVDEAWGLDFHCNGMCEFNGEVVFVGDRPLPVLEGRALRWAGSGTPVVFASSLPHGTTDVRYRSPVVAGGALHWLAFQRESDIPPVLSFGYIARYTDFSTGSDTWQFMGFIDDIENQPGFFIPYAGSILMLMRNTAPSSEWVDGDNILLVTSGSSANIDIVGTYPTIESETQLTPGFGFEAISL